MKAFILVLSLMFCSQLWAQPDQFHSGRTIADFGKIAAVKGMEPIPSNTHFKVSFDVDKAAEDGVINRSLDSAARFINMHVEAGVPVENLQIAMVIHGSAVKDMVNDEWLQASSASKNSNAELIQVLQKHGVQFYVCGQSAVYHGIKLTDLLPGVKMSLSAMTAHALLQKQGYTINPF